MPVHGSISCHAMSQSTEQHSSLPSNKEGGASSATPTSGSSPAPLLEDSEGRLWLLMPHVALALAILLVLFVDFLVYRRRTRLQQKRMQEKQELLESYPSRVIGGVYRNMPNVSTSSILRMSNSLSAEEAEEADQKDKTSTADSARVPASGQLSVPEAGHRQPQKKKHKLLENLKLLKNKGSFKAESAGSAESTSGSGNTAAAGRANTQGSRRRLQKREACLLPPLQDLGLANGVVHKEKVSPSVVDQQGERNRLPTTKDKTHKEDYTLFDA